MVAITNALWTNFELVSHSGTKEAHSARIKLLNNSTVNDLLRVAISAVEVQAVNEVIPSMNDIFIKVVEKKSGSDE